MEETKKGNKKMKNVKRNVTLIVVLLCVAAAVYLNWAYNNQQAEESVFSDAELAAAKSDEETIVSDEDFYSEYFAQARLTRQQSRDEALALLEAAATSETASQETIDGAMGAISVMATYTMQETQIENLLLAKNFSECVAFMSADGIIIAVPAPAEGLSAAEVAKITDAIVSETDYTAGQIRVIEVKKPAAAAPDASPAASPAVNPDTLPDDSAGAEGEAPPAGGSAETYGGDVAYLYE